MLPPKDIEGLSVGESGGAALRCEMCCLHEDGE